MGKYQNTGGAQPIIEERESARFLQSIESFVLSPAGKNYTYWFSTGTGFAFVFLAVGYDKLWLMLPGFAFSFAGIGGIFMLKGRLAEYQPQSTYYRSEFMQQPDNQPESNDITFDLENGLLPATIWQPYPGAFRQWLAEVLANDKTQFSLNQARARKWSDNRYHSLVTQLREAGLLHRNETKNGAPICTDEGKKRAAEWLKR